MTYLVLLNKVPIYAIWLLVIEKYERLLCDKDRLVAIFIFGICFIALKNNVDAEYNMRKPSPRFVERFHNPLMEILILG